MPEESTTPDLVEALPSSLDSGDIDGFLSFLAPDAVWDISRMDFGIFEGVAAIRAFLKEWLAAYDALDTETEELHDLGNGVLFGVFTQKARLKGSTGDVQQRSARVFLVADGVIVRIMSYSEIDEARAAAGRLAESRE